jgi:glycosyltransferase involved in cell wall biosynthesis
MKMIVIIPAYNEEDSISKVMTKVKELYGGIPLVIDDGSTDKTYEIAKAFGGLVIRHPYNRGLGASTRTGLQRAYELGADIAIKIDADNQHDPEDIKKVIEPIIEDRADVVFGSRFMGGLKYKMPLYRALGNIFFSYLTSILTGLKVTDGQTGLMAFSKRYLKDMNIISDYNETQQLIIDAWSKHMRVVEIPVVFNPRTTGKSFISFKYPFKVLPTLFRFLVTVNPLKIFLPLGVLLIVLGFICMGLVFVGYTQIVGKIGTAILIIGGLQVIMLGLLADAVSNKR